MRTLALGEVNMEERIKHSSMDLFDASKCGDILDLNILQVGLLTKLDLVILHGLGSFKI